MNTQDLFKTASELEEKIKLADVSGRAALQPELSRILERLKADGQAIPPRLQQLNTTLCDEAIEGWFDNMPV